MFRCRAPTLPFAVGRAWGVLAPALGRRSLLLIAALLGHARGVRVLHPGGLVATAGVLACGATPRPGFGARLLSGRGAARRNHSALTVLAFDVFGLGGLAPRLGEVGEPFPPEILQHLPHDGRGKLQVKRESLPARQHFVSVAAFVAEGPERLRYVLGRYEGIAAGRHAQVLEQRKVQPPDHTDHGLGLVDATPDEETGVVAVCPALHYLGLVHVVVLGDPVLELPEQTSRQYTQVLVPEKPPVALDVHDAARVWDGQGLFFVLERLAELADQRANLFLATTTLHQGGFVNDHRGLGTCPRCLVEPARRPLQAPVVVLEVPDPPRRFGYLVCQLDQRLSLVF